MEAVKQQILGLAGWSDKEKGKAIFKLNDSNVRNLANLPPYLHNCHPWFIYPFPSH